MQCGAGSLIARTVTTVGAGPAVTSTAMRYVGCTALACAAQIGDAAPQKCSPTDSALEEEASSFGRFSPVLANQNLPTNSVLANRPILHTLSKCVTSFSNCNAFRKFWYRFCWQEK